MGSSNEHKVLIIAYHFPPLAGAGMLKILRTTRYLPKFGWKPLVLTVKNPEPYHQAANPIPDGVNVYRAWRIPGGNLLARVLRRLKIDERWVMLPDQYVFWIPGVFFYGLTLIIREKPDLIYVTGPPYSALIAGVLLKMFTGIKLVTDIRDPWTFNAARRKYPTRFHRAWDRFLEKRVLRAADYVTCIYRITENGYRERYPWMGSKIAVFYDTVDIRDLPREIEPYSKFTLTYLGTFYPPFQSLRATLTALKNLLTEGIIDPRNFSFRYVGPPDKTFDNMVRELEIETLVSRAGYKTLPVAQQEAFNSQMLLLLLEFATINTKLFDYLASGNAILAVVPPCEELNGLLKTYAERYSIVSDLDALKIADSIKQCYIDFQQGKLQRASDASRRFIEQLNIEHETKELSEIFNRLIADGGTL